MSYLHSNPLAEHNSGIALSSKDIPQNSGTGNMYQGQGGRAFVQGGGGMSQFYSFNPSVSESENVHARGSYAPVSVGINSSADGMVGGRGSRRQRKKSQSRSKSRSKSTYRNRRRRITKCKKCKCDIITGVGGRGKKKCCNKKVRKTQRNHQHGGSMFANAAYSVAGSGTEVGPATTALANPAPYTAYNSCHPVQ
jgi:hypothetical protein